MNIITKLINRLIHLLGGYTREEYAYIMDKWGESLGCNEKLYEIKENRLRIAKSNVEYWCGKYTAEHEAYLTLLNCHNATAEAAQTALAPVEMAKAIKAYCAERDDCSECRLAGENGKCNVDEIPCYWEVE